MAEECIAHVARACPKCAEFKPATTEFFSFNVCRQKLNSWCKACSAAARRADRAKRPEHYARIDARSKKKNEEKVRARVNQHYAANRDKLLEKTRARMIAKRDIYNRNRREKLLKDAEYRARLCEARKRHREQNLEKYKAYHQKRWASASAAYKFKRSFGSAISHSLAGRGKGGRTWAKLVGYSVEELRAHLERQFLKGMSWDNYGEWHIDHILPLASFEFDGPDNDEFRRAWALTNLRPLWSRDNIRKGAKRLLLI